MAWKDPTLFLVDTSKAEGKHFIINLINPDNDEKYLTELSNSTLTSIEGVQSPKADLTITMNRSDLNDIMMGTVSFDEKIEKGKATLKGNRKAYDELESMLTTFTMAFELLPGTLPDNVAAPAKGHPFKQKGCPLAGG